MDHLKGKVAVVTGAGGGVGRAEALALAAHGAKIVVNDAGVDKGGRGGDQGPADAVVAEIQGRGGEAVANYGDVSDSAAAKAMISAAMEHFGRLDILVNNAGIIRYGLFHELPEADWDQIVAVHLKGTYNTCRNAVPIMLAQGSGRIINTTSSQWRNPEGLAAYATAKGAIVSLTWDLAWELDRHGITVNAIAPLAGTRAYSAGASFKPLRDAGMKFKARGDEKIRPGPEWVAPMVVYLASDWASNVNGCVFRVGSGKIGIYSHPTEARTIYRDHTRESPWSIDELSELLPASVLSGATKAPHIVS